MAKRCALLALLAILFVVAACAPLDPVSQSETPIGSEVKPEGVRETPAPPKEINPDPVGVNPDPVDGVSVPTQEVEMIFQTIRQSIADRIGTNADQLHLREITAVEWPDGCLGLAAPDQMCIQVITPGYRLIVEAEGKTYEVRTNLDGSMVKINAGMIAQPPVTGPAEIPSECLNAHDTKAYVDFVNAFCFSFPADMLQDERGLAAVYAQPKDPTNPEEVVTRLDIFASPSVPNTTLETLVSDFQKQFEGANSPVKITRSAVELGGEPALMLEPVPGRLSSRMVFALRNGIFYQLIFFPLDEPSVKADFDRLYDAVISSFTFLP
ncbi:MAG: hypothetical protein AB1453_06540 [Chloroflexota bacterium]|jgi:hypothetical protein